MKMIYNGTPVSSIKVKHYEIPTNDCDMIASDIQAGKTGVARGQKITGTGKSFEFACYGDAITNMAAFIPTTINVIEITSLDYPIRSSITFAEMIDIDFATEKMIGVVLIDGEEYPITLSIQGNILTFNCEKTISLQFFYGRDNYI